jgi:hypothetical protein
MMEKLTQPGEGGECTPIPFAPLPSRAKLWCTLQLKGQIRTLPLFLLYPYMYSAVEGMLCWCNATFLVDFYIFFICSYVQFCNEPEHAWIETIADMELTF